jgi:sugar/nucleoside kinase (ribokinase family)
MVDKKGNRRFAYYGKCNDQLSVSDIDDSQFKAGGIVHVGSAMALASLDGPGLAELFKKAKDKGCVTSLDVTWDRDGKWLPKIEAALRYTDLFLPSLYEAKLITKKESPRAIAEFFSAYGISKLVIKMGAQGCYLTDFKDTEILLPAPDVPVVDTTGAGDAFVSGFLFGVKNDLPFRACGVLGGLVSGEAIGAFGATTGVRGTFFNHPEETKKILQKAIEA